MAVSTSGRTRPRKTREKLARIRLWKKGSRSDPNKYEEVYLVSVPDSYDRALRGRFSSAAAARKAALAAGLKLVADSAK